MLVVLKEKKKREKPKAKVQCGSLYWRPTKGFFYSRPLLSMEVIDMEGSMFSAEGQLPSNVMFTNDGVWDPYRSVQKRRNFRMAKLETPPVLNPYHPQSSHLKPPEISNLFVQKEKCSPPLSTPPPLPSKFEVHPSAKYDQENNIEPQQPSFSQSVAAEKTKTVLYVKDNSNYSPPVFDKNDMCQYLEDFEKYCVIVEASESDKRRLLLEQLQRFSQDAFKSFLRSENTNYNSLRQFLLRRFKCVAKVHKVELNPLWINDDAYTHFSKAVDLCTRTPSSELVKFFVMKTSPIALQKEMKGFLNMPYENFFQKFQDKLSLFNNSYDASKQSDKNIDYESKQNNLKSGDSICSYHKIFGKKARNCDKPNCKLRGYVADAINAYKSENLASKNEGRRD